MTAKKRKRPSLKKMSGSVAAAKESVRKLQAEETEQQAEAKPARSKATFDLDADLLQELRVLSFEVPPRAIDGSLSGLVEKAVRREVEELRDAYNDGEPFEAGEPVKARRGRPPRV